jgi:glucosamine kinase
MHLIVDSGSTKTIWCLVDKDQLIQEITTTGMNPYISSGEMIQAIVELEVVSQLLHAPDAIYFYGAGCSTIEHQSLITHSLRRINNLAHIEVHHDLLAVARALCQHQSGIAVILGTGSNSCLYNGKDIIKNTPSLGYILGDEGSGSFIGKTFLADLFYNNVPSEIKSSFKENYPYDLNYYLNKIYKEPNANAFLASFCTWLSNHRENDYVHQLLINSFALFIDKHIVPYGKEITNTIFSNGSIAFFFMNEWKEVILQKGYVVGNMEQNPISGLIKYHHHG